MLPHDKPVSEIIRPNAEDFDGDYWDPWESLGLHCCSYNSAIDQQAIGVLRLIGGEKPMYCTDIAEQLGMTPEHVELFQSIFSGAGWCEYGMSPRGCWPIDRKGFPALVAAWEQYYERQWKEPASGTLPRENTEECSRAKPSGPTAESGDAQPTPVSDPISNIGER